MKQSSAMSDERPADDAALIELAYLLRVCGTFVAAEEWAERLEAYAARLTALNAELSERIEEGERLREVVTDARSAIASLPEDGLGMAQIAFGTPGVDVYPIRDELLSKIDAALSTPSRGGHDAE